MSPDTTRTIDASRSTIRSRARPWTACVLGLATAAQAGAGTVVGRIAGSFDSTATGAATYTIPIQVAAGVNDLRPAIALSYNSQTGDGLAGPGWTLTGFSEIARCGLMRGLDARAQGVRFIREDRYCLDGQPLVLVNGTHGSAGAEYRPEVHAFERIIAHGQQGTAPAWFELRHPDGTIYRYGNDADSRVEAAGGTAEIRAWALNEIVDRFGQRVGYAYAEDGAGGEHLPAEIRWTYGPAESFQQGRYRLLFSWEPRPATEVRGGFLWGTPWTASRRLAAIDYQFDAGSGLARVHRYSLAYTQAAADHTHRSQLASVTQCGLTECLPPTTMAWDGAAAERVLEFHTGLPIDKTVLGDYNGDGAADLFGSEGGRWAVWPANPQGGGFLAPVAIGGTVVTSSVAMPLDYNGDGLTDLMTGSSQGANWLVYLSPATPGAAFQVKNTGVRWAADTEVLPLDIDADGLDDIVYLRDAIARVRRNVGASLAPESSSGMTPVTPGLEAYRNGRGYLRAADFDGDGRRDLLVARSQPDGTSLLWEAFLSTGTGFGPTPIAALNTYLGRDTAHVLDINGDGLSDVFALIRATLSWQSMLSRGTGTTAAPGLIPAACPDPISSSNRYFHALDVDGDGRSELLTSYGSPSRILRSDAGCFSDASFSEFRFPFSDSRLLIADANGDGSADVFFGSSQAGKWAISRSGSWTRPDGVTVAHRADLLREITDGLGNSHELFYRHLTGWSGYAAPYGNVANTRQLRGGPVTVLSEYRTGSGASAGGGEARFGVTFTYADARVDRLGRGYFGFGTVRGTDSRSGLVTETVYRQDFPYAGRPERISVWNGTSRVSERDPTWTVSVAPAPDAAADVHFVHLAAEVTDDYEVDADGGLAGSLVRRTSRSLAWNFSHGAVTSEQVAVSSPLQAGASYRTTRAVTLDDALRSAAGCLGYPTRVDVTREVSGTATQTHSVQYSYDPLNCSLVTRLDGAADVPAEQLWTIYSHDPQGRVRMLVRTDGVSQLPPRQTRYTYGAGSSRPLTEAQGLNGEADMVVTRQWHEALGVEATRTGPQGTTIAWGHDEFGRVRVELPPTGATIIDYTACGPCFAPGARYAVRQLRTDGYWSETQHDSYGRVVGRAFVLPDGRSSRQLVEYDALGRVRRESVPFVEDTPPLYWTSYAWDVLGRPKSVDRPLGEAAPAGAVSTLTYAGTNVTARDAAGRATVRAYDAEGRLLAVQAPLGGGAAFAYDAFGQLSTVTDAAGNLRRFGYDRRGLLAQLDDPDAGRRTYAHNAFGEPVSQADGRSPAAVTTFQYDQLGRMTSRSEPEGTTTWTYSAIAGPSRGQLQQVTGPADSGPAGYRESYVYDGAGRLRQTTTVIDGSSYVTDYAFDVEGKLVAMTYPATIGWRPKFLFGYSRGHLATITQEALAVTPVYALLELDAQGREVAARYGAGSLEERNVYDGASNRLTAIRSGPPASPASVQNYAYEWDAVGNLLSRHDLGAVPRLEERFAYDSLNRLSQATLNGVPTLAMAYGPDGNILAKSDAGSFSYGAGGALPHAVTSVTGGPRGTMTFAYDANGNMTNRNGTLITWTSFNLPRQVSAGADYARFAYGPGRARIRQDLRSGPVTRTVHYVGPHFEVEIEGTLRRYRASVFAYGRAVYSQVETTPSGLEAYYVLHDHAGSVDRLVRAVGTGADALAHAFDAWGKRRNPDWSADPTDQRYGDRHWTERGYTGHEHLDNVRLVHMNGRLEDPLLGRMLAPDPVLGSLLNAQGLNPYSYVVNNPSSYVDPSGYFLSKLRKFFKRAISHVGSFGRRLVRRWGRQIAAVAAAWFTSGVVSSWSYSAQMPAMTVGVGGPAVFAAEGAAGTLTATLPAGVVLGGIAGGAAAGAIATGTVKGATVGAISGGTIAGIGGFYGGSYTAGRVLAEGAVSGASSAVQGGEFADGFFTAAGVSSLTWASLEMRRAMIEQSRLRYDGASPLYARDNASGLSLGFRGDGFKLGGCRNPCGNSPLGGMQGGPGNVFGMPYGPGSFFDRLVETYAGPHDFLNAPLFYDAWGNNAARPDFVEIVNAANVLVATPFAAASVIPGYAYGALAD